MRSTAWTLRPVVYVQFVATLTLELVVYVVTMTAPSRNHVRREGLLSHVRSPADHPILSQQARRLFCNHSQCHLHGLLYGGLQAH